MGGALPWKPAVTTWTRPTPAAYPKPDYPDDLPCKVYFIYVYDPRNPPNIVVGYIGETSRADLDDADGPQHPAVRFEEHAGIRKSPGQPWSDTLPFLDAYEALREGMFVVSEETYPNKAAAYVAEEAAIRRYRPLYNHEYNLDNPRRISIPEARRQRADRDKRAGVPADQTWAHLHEMAELRDRDPAAAVTVTARSWWRTLWQHPKTPARVGMFLLWLIPTLLLWWAAATWTPVASTPRLGAVSGCLVAAGMLRISQRRRRRVPISRVAARWLLLGFAAWLLVWPGLAHLAR